MYCYNNCLLGNVETDEMIECDLCTLWVHKNCAAQHDEAYKEILDAPKKTKVVFWRCKECRVLFLRLKAGYVGQKESTNDSLSQEFLSLQNEIRDLRQQFDTEKEMLLEIIKAKQTEVNNLQSQIDNIHEKANKLSQSFFSSTNSTEKRDPTESPIPDRQINSAEQERKTGNASPTSTPTRTPRARRRRVTQLNERKTQNRSANSPHTASHSLETTPETHESLRRETLTQETTRRIPIFGRTDSLILGCSLLRGMKRYIEKREAYIACRPGTTCTLLQEEVDKWSVNEDMRSVVLIAGGNDLSNMKLKNETMDDVVGNMWHLVRTLKEKFPRATININGILRRGRHTEMLSSINNNIAWMCTKENVVFTDPNSAIQNHHFAADRVHINKQGSETLANFLKNFLNFMRQTGGKKSRP